MLLVNDADERGNESGESVAELQQLCESEFDGDIAAGALVLGREEEQLSEMLAGEQPVDEDLAMKIHGVTAERGVDLG